MLNRSNFNHDRMLWCYLHVGVIFKDGSHAEPCSFMGMSSSTEALAAVTS